MSNKISVEFQLERFIPEKKYPYVSDFFEDYKDFINQFDVVILYSKKGKGKSEVGYRMCQQIIKEMSGNIVYGRLQLIEKQNAYNELFKTFMNRGLKPEKLKSFGGKDYIGFNNIPLLRLINISSYQSVRGAVAESFYIYKTRNHQWKIMLENDPNFDDVKPRLLSPKLIWFDEINALSFPPNFEVQFLQMLDTIGRSYDYKLFCSGNNETAVNNPILSVFQLKFDWNYTGVQLAYRIVDGVKVLGIQLGVEAFDEVTNPPTIAERLAKGTAMYETYFVGNSNLNGQQNVINLREDYKVGKTILYWAEAERVYRFSQAEIKDEINNIIVKSGIIVEEINSTFEREYNPKIPFYTTDKFSNDIFKDVVYLDDEQATNVLTPYALMMKKRILFFNSFNGLEDMTLNFDRYNRTYQPLKENEF